MIVALRRHAAVYGALAMATTKVFLAYRLWFWVTLLGQLLSVTIFVSFWRAVYADQNTVGGLHAHQTITYIILTQTLVPIAAWSVVSRLGYLIRDGTIGNELVRPLDFQARFYVEGLTASACNLLQQAIPIGLLAALFFGFRLPVDPVLWAAFAVSFLFGTTISFCVDWLIGCLAFYTTEVWGLGVLRNGIALFFGGALIPLVMLPHALRTVAFALPFGQAVYTPISLLSGITPVGQAPRILLVQLAWIAGLGLAARLLFVVAVRRVTVQGG